MLSPHIPSVRRFLGWIHRLALIPFEWKAGSPFPSLTSCPKKLRQFRACLHLTLSHGLLLILNYIFSFSRLDISEKLLGVFFLSAFNFVGEFGLNFLWKGKELMSLFRALVRFEERNHFVQKRPQGHSGQALTQLILSVGSAGSTFIAIAFGGLLYAKPCLAPTLGHLLLREGSHWMWKWTILTIEVAIFFANVSVVAFYTFHCCFLALRSLESYLRYARRFLLRARASWGHRTMRGPRGLQLYRQIHLLSILLNEVFQTWFLPIFMLNVWGYLILSLYTCVKLHHVVKMPAFAFFPVVLIHIPFAIFVVKVAANVAHQSGLFLGKAKRNPSVDWRTVRSLAGVKVRFGSSNFVDHLTPFNLVNHALNNCVSLLLLT